MMFKIDDYVTITDDGELYGGFKQWADSVGATNWARKIRSIKNRKGIIVRKAMHLDAHKTQFKDKMLYLVEFKGGKQIIMGEDGLSSDHEMNMNSLERTVNSAIRELRKR
jgi:hypothetical protein